MSITRFTIFLCICTVTFTPKCPRFYLTFTLPHPMFTRSQNMQYRARGAGFADEIVDSCRLSMHCLGFCLVRSFIVSTQTSRHAELCLICALPPSRAIPAH